MDYFTNTFFYAFAALFSMLNPIGMSAVFLGLTKDYSPAARHKMAYKVAMYAAILLIASFFVGPYLLRFFGISLSSIQVAGGMLVFYTAWGMLDTKPKMSNSEIDEASKNTDITFFPLTMPITAGAGAIAVAITQAAKITNSNGIDILGAASSIAAIMLVCVTVAFSYRFSDEIFNRLGSTGTNVVTRLTAFILLAISVNVIWEGVLGFIQPVLH
jgi:multiple antibiotic resistance protein